MLFAVSLKVFEQRKEFTVSALPLLPIALLSESKKPIQEVGGNNCQEKLKT
jgi:hypothetical protein